jgi:hypothetical protein
MAVVNKNVQVYYKHSETTVKQVTCIDYYCLEETKIRQTNHHFKNLDFVILKVKGNPRNNLV